MSNKEITAWGIHGGRTGDADKLFLQKNYIAIGWHGMGSVGDPVVSSLYGKVDNGEYGLLVTLGTFTSQAKNFAKNKSNLRLIDGSELVELILNHYEQLDSRYKGLIPLKRVYIPERISEQE